LSECKSVGKSSVDLCKYKSFLGSCLAIFLVRCWLAVDVECSE